MKRGVQRVRFIVRSSLRLALPQERQRDALPIR